MSNNQQNQQLVIHFDQLLGETISKKSASDSRYRLSLLSRLYKFISDTTSYTNYTSYTILADELVIL